MRKQKEVIESKHHRKAVPGQEGAPGFVAHELKCHYLVKSINWWESLIDNIIVLILFA